MLAKVNKSASNLGGHSHIATWALFLLLKTTLFFLLCWQEISFKNILMRPVMGMLVFVKLSLSYLYAHLSYEVTEISFCSCSLTSRRSLGTWWCGEKKALFSWIAFLVGDTNSFFFPLNFKGIFNTHLHRVVNLSQRRKDPGFFFFYFYF